MQYAPAGMYEFDTDIFASYEFWRLFFLRGANSIFPTHEHFTARNVTITSVMLAAERKRATGGLEVPLFFAMVEAHYVRDKGNTATSKLSIWCDWLRVQVRISNV